MSIKEISVSVKKYIPVGVASVYRHSKGPTLVAFTPIVQMLYIIMLLITETENMAGNLKKRIKPKNCDKGDNLNTAI